MSRTFEVIEGGATPSVQARVVRLLAQREHSRQALQDKLRTEGVAPEAVTDALDRLQARGLVNDARVAETLVNRRASKWGAARLRQDLQAKGVSPEVVADTMVELKATELARAQGVWARKFGQRAPDAVTRQRQARFLTSRGFSAEVVRQVVAGLADAMDDSGS